MAFILLVIDFIAGFVDGSGWRRTCPKVQPVRDREAAAGRCSWDCDIRRSKAERQRGYDQETPAYKSEGQTAESAR